MDCLDKGALSYDGASVFCLILPFKINNMAISTGQQAPDFTLYSSDKEKITLSDLRGKSHVLLLFFPMAFTRVCTKELCSVRDSIGHYNNASVQVLGISVDSVFTLAKFKEEQQYNFPLLSDFNKEVSTLYGAIYESFGDMEMRGVSKRAAFLVDKNGVVQYAEVLEKAGEEPDFEAIDRQLATLH